MRHPYISASSLLAALVFIPPAGAQEAECGSFRHHPNIILTNRIREAVPGMGGFHWDDQCNFVVLLTDSSYADSARSCFRQLLPTSERYGGKQCAANPTVRILPAKFAYGELELPRALLSMIMAEIRAGAWTSVDDSTQAFEVQVKNERARSDAEHAIRAESRLAPYTINVVLKPPEHREFDGPVEPPGSVYTAAIWHLKTVFETRINGYYQTRRLRLQCVTFNQVPESLGEIDLTPLALWFGDCGRGQTIRFGGVRGFQSGGYGIQTSLSGWCGEIKVDPRQGGWSARYITGECGVSGVRNPRVGVRPADDAAAYDEVMRLELLSSDSADVFPGSTVMDPSNVDIWPGDSKLVPTTDSVFYLLRQSSKGAELWGKRLVPPSGLDSIAFRIKRPFHYVVTTMQKAYVLDIPAGTIVVFDTAGNQVASRALPAGLADTLRAAISFSGRPSGYTLSTSVSSFRAESGKLVVTARRFVMIDPETLGVTTIGGPWRRFLWDVQKAVRGDTLFTLSRFDRLIRYRMVPVPDGMPLVQPEFPAF